MTNPLHILGLFHHHCCALLHHVWECLHKRTLVAAALPLPLCHKCPVLCPVHLSVSRCVDSPVLQGKHIDTVMVSEMILVCDIPVMLGCTLVF